MRIRPVGPSSKYKSLPSEHWTPKGPAARALLDAGYAMLVEEMAKTMRYSYDTCGTFQVVIRRSGSGLRMAIKVYNNGKLLDGIEGNCLGWLAPETVTDDKPRELKPLPDI